MKVINKRADEFVPFSELNLGDLFECDGQILMKVTECTYKEGLADTTVNSIDVSCGCFHFYFNKSEMVKKVNGTLMIE